jgi:glycosyltransferase involved in cell wall biosynthesis
MNEEYKYKFSVIIPIYNVEEYIEETIISVIHQSIGFKNNIQMILVNDGSPDNSEEICLKYAEKYPENIKYIKKENGGVSSARNLGIDYIEGKYVNFLDSDDKWEKTAFKKVYDFFEENYDEIDSVSCPLEYFEAMTGMGHPLNFKFDANKVIDIHEDYNQVQLHAASSFYKAEVAREHRFDSNLKYGEDIKFITEIILNKEKFGVVSNTSYLYRKRLSETSALQNRKPYDWYVKTPKLCFEY